MGLVADKEGSREGAVADNALSGEWSIPDEEMGRAETYRLIALLLSAAPSADLIGSLSEVPDQDSELGRAIGALGRMGQAAGPSALHDEYGDLFVGLPVPALMPYASQYMNGQLFGRALAELRMDMANLGIARNENATEPEDHIATLCEIMAGLITGAFGRPPLPIAEQAAFFRRHFTPWVDQFFDDLAGAERSSFYMAVAQLGSQFTRLEAESFAFIEG